MMLESKRTIRVLVVEDSPLMSKVLADVLNADPQLIVIGFAHNGKEAVEIVPQLKPDVITMDINMPVMDGLEATRYIMASYPTPILIISTSGLKTEMKRVLKALSYGALDVFDKSLTESVKGKEIKQEIIERIKFLNDMKVMRYPLTKLKEETPPLKIFEMQYRSLLLDRIVAIVASTGGPYALLKILCSFPKEFPCAIVIVQHIVSGFVETMADWLDSECQIQVKLGEDSERIISGVAYIAPSGVQMIVDEGGIIRLEDRASLYDSHKPSGNVLFESVAKVYKEKAIGVVLTGMGKDGAVGLQAIKEQHGCTIVQDEASCVVFGMPKEAIDRGAADKVVPLEKIAAEIIDILNL
jgi:two-component system chemotaxis response regulator CheB